MPETWPARMAVEMLAAADAAIESYAELWESIFPGSSFIVLDAWRAVRPAPMCDCPMDPYHRWNCVLTPIWAQTIRDLDCNPWTVIRPWDITVVHA